MSYSQRIKRIVHVSNDYLGSSVYESFFKSIHNSNVDQEVICFVRPTQLVSKSKENTKWKEYIIEINSFISIIGRVLPWLRDYVVIKKMTDFSDFSKDCIIHAHTLYANGSLAYHMFKRYKTNYVVTIRNTDINMVLVKLFFLKGYIGEILIHSKLIIFPNIGYKNKLMDHFKKNHIVQNAILKKSVLLPSGLGEFWMKNCRQEYRVRNSDEPIRLLFVGEISPNKNLISLVKEIRNTEFQLTIIGGTKGRGKNEEYKRTLNALIKSIPNVSMKEEINDKEELRREYLNHHVFVMLSLSETFGLVYLEAMSQGLPIIYSEGEGIYGYFEEGHVGFSVNPKDLSTLKPKIAKIRDAYKHFSQNSVQEIKRFFWDRIAYSYLNEVDKISW